MFDAFYSDPHFGHKNIIGFCNRPFANLEEMHRTFIYNYNQLITENMLVLWLGDCFFKCDQYEMAYFMRKLNGRKALVRGNHDPSNTALLKAGFEFVVDTMTLMLNEQKCIVSHYPYALTDEQRQRSIAAGKHVDDRYLNLRPVFKKNQWLIHGHTHSDKVLGERKMLHVGVDAWGYRPAMMEEVKLYLL